MRKVRNVVQQQVEAMRHARRNALVDDMREGRRQRAVTVPAKRGKGSYRRRSKHGKWDT